MTGRRQQKTIPPGLTIKEIEARLGLNTYRVRIWCRENNYTLRKVILLRRFSALPPGLRADQAAKSLGISLAYARNLAKMVGYELRGYKSCEKWKSLDWKKRNIELAQELNVSRERVRQVRQAFGLPKAPRHAMFTFRSQIMERSTGRDVPAGLSVYALSTRFKCTMQTARKWCVERQYTPAPVARRSPVTERFLSLPPGLTSREIVNRLEISYQYAWKLARQHGYKLRHGRKK